MKPPTKDGYILVFTLAVLGILFVLTTAAINLVRFDQHIATRSYWNKQASSIAESGVNWAIRQLNTNSVYAGESNVTLGDGVFTTVVSGSGNTRTIESSGYVPNATNPRAKRKIIVTADTNSTEAEFFYGIQVDGGGLQMGNGSGVVGNVYSNGDIVGAPGAYITGDAVVAGGLNASPSLEWTVADADTLFATNNGNRDVAQSFIAPATDRLNRVSVYLGKVGTPTSNIDVRITGNDSDNTPLPSAIANGVIAASTVGSSSSWIDVSFPTSPDLTAGTKYWIILDNASGSGSNYWNWQQDSTNGYANNTAMYTSNWSTGGASWTNLNADQDFKVWVGGTATKIEGMTIGNSTSGTGHANAFVSTTIHGIACPNVYCIVDNPASQSLPFSDGLIQDWRDDATAGGTIIGDYSLLNSDTGSLGPKKIQGNLLMDNLSTLTVTGTIYVTGNITLSNNCNIILDPDYTAGSGVIVTDGLITIANNCAFTGAQSGSYVLLLTAKDDKNNVSVDIANNSAGVIYYAGKTRISFRPGATAKEVTAWGINLDNNAVITYETGLANVLFSGGPGGGWQVKVGTWREIRSF